MIRYRYFHFGDLYDIHRLSIEYIGENYQTSFFTNIQQYFPEGFIIAEDMTRGKVIGTMIALPTPDMMLRILMLAVDSSYRKSGIGGTLMYMLLHICARRNLVGIKLEVRVDNLNAIKFYQNRGYATVGVLANYYADGSSGYVMKKAFY